MLAFVAGAINAGGYLAVQQYTSHMTGLVSSVADQLVLGQWGRALDAVVAVVSFVLGAVTCTLLVHYARRRRWRSEYALPLLLEATLILGFGLLGARLSRMEGLLVPFTVVMLCFIMGLQNAMVTKLSKAVIRTTHMTGILTDLGIEVGRWLYWNRQAGATPVRADRSRLAVFGGLLTAFVVGGLTGAWGFLRVGYGWTVPLALLLAAMALVPLADDLRVGWRGWRRRR